MNGVHVDVFDRPCVGAAFYTPPSNCPSDRDVHLVSGLHVYAINGPGCQTGVALDPREVLLP